jgi:hypothetical protein
MDRLAILEMRKMMRELEFLRSDLEYKSEVVSDADSKFIVVVNDFLDSDPAKRALFDKKISERMEKMISNKLENLAGDGGESEAADSQISVSDGDVPGQKMKKLYREIVKVTHPDKTTDSRLNAMYLDAAMYYSDVDIMGIYSICDSLGIEYSVDAADIELISISIRDTRQKIEMIESTMAWAWLQGDDSVKAEMVSRYVDSQIR